MFLVIQVKQFEAAVEKKKTGSATAIERAASNANDLNGKSVLVFLKNLKSISGYQCLPRRKMSLLMLEAQRHHPLRASSPDPIAR